MFREILDNTRRAIAQDPAKANAAYRVKSRLLQGAKTAITAQSSDPMSFEQAATPNLGLGCSLEHNGRKVGMVPAEMYLGSIASCVSIAFAVYAELMDVSLDLVEVEVEGHVDLRGILDINPAAGIGFSRVVINALVQSGSGADRLKELALLADSKSPILHMARLAHPIERRYAINDQVLDLAS